MTALFLSAHLADYRQITWRGFIRMHAMELRQSLNFQRTGRISTGELHEISRDLALLGSQRSLDEVVPEILACADALELEHQADSKFRAQQSVARVCAAIEQERRAGVCVK